MGSEGHIRELLLDSEEIHRISVALEWTSDGDRNVSGGLFIIIRSREKPLEVKISRNIIFLFSQRYKTTSSF